MTGAPYPDGILNNVARLMVLHLWWRTIVLSFHVESLGGNVYVSQFRLNRRDHKIQILWSRGCGST